MRFILLLLLALSPYLKAETSVYLKSWSTHYISEDSGSYNETHKTIAIKINQYSLGYYVNSYYTDSYFIGYTKDLPSNFHLGFMLVTGYPQLEILPAPIFGYTWRILDLPVSPELEFNIIPGAITSSFKLTF